MVTKKFEEANESRNTHSQTPSSQTKNDSSNLYLIIVAALVIIVAVFIMIRWGNVAGIKITGTRDIGKQELLNLEYAKHWGKENYEVVQKMQLKQIEQFVAQSKGQNAGPQAAWDDKAAPADTKTMTQDEIKALKDSSYIDGNKSAKITVYEFSDLECPFCIRQFKEWTINKVLEKFGDKVNTAFKNFPLDFHKNAAKESEAALCVGSIAGVEKYTAFYKVQS